MQVRTRRQREVLDYIVAFIAERGYEPSYQQIAIHFRIASKSAIAKHVAALEEQGLLSRHRQDGKFGLSVTSKENVSELVYEIQWLELPFVSDTADDWEVEPLFIPQFLLGNILPDRVRAFRVQSDSMLNEHIREGDVVFVEMRPYARDGDAVVAVLDKSSVVLMKYYRDGASVELRPANTNFESIFIGADRILIRGVVKALLRPSF